ncbi:unnamed protein product, partial [Rotaria sordida]
MTSHCKIYKAPSNYSVKQHAIGYKMIIDSANQDLVHHLLIYECDPTAQFDDNNLPDDLCNEIYLQTAPCAYNGAIIWDVGGNDIVAFPEEAGYPIGGDFLIKYYMVQIHYNNPNQLSNRTDSSGIRFYIGKELRQHDLGYLTLGTTSTPHALAIPPKMERFIIDSYCPATATMGDELTTRCIYNTINKNTITLGGERAEDEMCRHVMKYYPRMNNMYDCLMMNSPQIWNSMMNTSSSSFNDSKLMEWLLNLTWTSEQAVQWQEFYNIASRVLLYGASSNLQFKFMSGLPKYQDLKPVACTKDQTINQTTSSQTATMNESISYTSRIRQNIMIILI